MKSHNLPMMRMWMHLPLPRAAFKAQLTDDVKRYCVVDRRRLPEVHPAHVRASVESLHPSHAENGRAAG